jgi:hypothetical protein
MATSRTIHRLAAPMALALAIGLAATVPAHASSTTQKDPRNDVFLASVGGGIDLAAVRLETLDRKRSIRITFTLHTPTTLEGSLEKPGGMSVHFIRSQRIRRVVGIATKDGVLTSQVCSYSTAARSIKPDCSRLPVSQVDGRTYVAVVKRAQVKQGARVLQWTASSIDLSQGQPVSDQLTAKNRTPFRWRL